VHNCQIFVILAVLDDWRGYLRKIMYKNIGGNLKYELEEQIKYYLKKSTRKFVHLIINVIQKISHFQRKHPIGQNIRDFVMHHLLLSSNPPKKNHFWSQIYSPKSTQS